MDEIRPLRFGIVGCGGAAAAFAQATDTSDRAVVAAVHDRDLARAERLAVGRDATVHRTLGSLLRDDAVDAVYVALPHDRLAATAIAVLRSGRHVLVEKPVGTRIASITAVRRAAVDADRRVGVAFELRFVPTVAAASRLVSDAALGRLRMVRIRTLIDKPPAYWAAGPTGTVRDPWRASRRRAGGGVVLMNSVHQLDLVRAITGRSVVRVAALASAGVAGVEVEDTAAATFELEGGLLGSLVASAHAPGIAAGETIEIDGDDGALRLGDPYVTPPTLAVFLRRPAGGLAVERWVDVATSPVDPWRAAIDAFVDAVRAGREPSPGLDDAEAALAAVLAVYRSVRTGRFERVRVADASRVGSGRQPGSPTAG